jgi:hypothetical protein
LTIRTLIVGLFVVFSLSLASVPQVSMAVAQEGCSCKGCGCKGGPGWRGPEGTCVSKAKLAAICGSPPAAPCLQEAAVQVCFGKPAGGNATEVPTEAQ